MQWETGLKEIFDRLSSAKVPRIILFTKVFGFNHSVLLPSP